MTTQIGAIVPIREHSERLPRKNFRDFNGRPLYHWILETLEQVNQIDRIIVNTNADEVIEQAPTLFDVEISERPDEFLGDDTTTRVIKYEVDRLDFDVYMHTYCTHPLLESSTISTALEEFLASSSHDSLFTVTEHRKRMYDSDLDPINHDPYDLERTQDLQPVYEDNSCLYVYTEESINATSHRIGENPMTHVVEKIESIEIDNKPDFDLAEYFHRNRM